MNILQCRANLSVTAILGHRLRITNHWSPVIRRGGRAVDCAGLEPPCSLV